MTRAAGTTGCSAAARPRPTRATACQPLRNTRENFIRAAGKHGLDVRDIPACITFFAGVQTGAGGRFQWRDDVVHPGATVDLVAAMDLLVALSNCPHPLCPTPPSAITAIVWDPGPNADHAARQAGPRPHGPSKTRSA